MNRPLRATVVACACLLAVVACKRTDAPAAPAAAQTETPAPAADQPAAQLSQTPEPPAQAAPTEAGSEPETPTLKTATVDGKAWDLAAQRGKWVVVNFWATWCAPCRKEMPELSALDAMRENIEVIGLAYEDIEPTDMQAFLKKNPVVYPVAIIDTMNPPADFASPRGLPMTYLVAPDGKIAKRFLGPVTAKEIEDVIAAAGGDKASAA